ncbi:MAG: DUF2807 domain-containing protein [Spirochaetales bacterium]|nr:DUF2807 domain-containing protein [Spirochaetales bacterium]
MKKSGIVLFGGALFIFIILLSALFFFRYHAYHFLVSDRDSDRFPEAAGIVETRTYSFSDYNSLYFENMWDVEITGSDRYYMEIEADRSLLDIVDITKEGTVVRLSYEGYVRGLSDQNDTVKVRIGLPEIGKIEFAGMGNIELKEFNLDSLEINNSGASNIEAEDVVVRNLSLTVNGAANADFHRVSVENCHLDISGAAKIRLNMSGGLLTGQVSGAASVDYSGTVSEQSVEVSGIGSLEHI